MQLASLDPSDPTPRHEQVAASLRRAIGDGECRPGERLPRATDLAAAFDINANTVLRALRTLRDEGLLEFRRGRGITVRNGVAGRGLVIVRARELVAAARKAGLSRDELIAIIKEIR
jgi:GntR family transcriptional regulator